MQKSFYFRQETKRFEDELDQKIKALEAKASQLDQVDLNIQDIVHSAAQNMRTSLVVIKAYSNLLMHYDGKEKADALAHMKASALKIERIINRMIELTDAQEGGVIPGRKLSFIELLDEVQSHLSDDIETIQPVFETKFEVKRIYYNKFNLFSLLFCILSNSLSYHEEHKPLRIQVRTCRQNKYVVLEIEDNGTGFDLQKHMQSIFKPFSKADIDQDGLGTGLYLVKNIVEKDGGYVELKSSPGEGTLVRLYLKPLKFIQRK